MKFGKSLAFHDIFFALIRVRELTYPFWEDRIMSLIRLPEIGGENSEGKLV